MFFLPPFCFLTPLIPSGFVLSVTPSEVSSDLASQLKLAPPVQLLIESLKFSQWLLHTCSLQKDVSFKKAKKAKKIYLQSKAQVIFEEVNEFELLFMAFPW